MSNPFGCAVNPATGYCESCSCYTARGRDGEFFCVAAEAEREQHQRQRDETDFLPEDEPEQELIF